MSRNVKTGRTVGCDRLDATAWDETESIHTLSNGDVGASNQTSVPIRHDPRKLRENHSQGRTPMLGLLTLPPDVVVREETNRPISKGRKKPHFLAPATVVCLSFDPVRMASDMIGR